MGSERIARRTSGKQVSRRDFLSLAWKLSLSLSALLGLDGILRYFSFQTDPPRQTRFDLGPEAEFPPGSRTVISEAQAILLNTPGGFVALSLVCPHLGCTVEENAEGFACPCHGSRFGPDGELVRGPAAAPMKPLRLETSPEGNLILWLT